MFIFVFLIYVIIFINFCNSGENMEEKKQFITYYKLSETEFAKISEELNIYTTDFEYAELTDGSIELVKYTGNSADVEIPEEINGRTVTVIGKYCFLGNEQLESVVINDNIREIGRLAFADCVSLYNISIPDGCQKIGENAFYNCTSLIEVYIPKSVSELPRNTFKGCTKLNNLTFRMRYPKLNL